MRIFKFIVLPLFFCCSGGVFSSPKGATQTSFLFSPTESLGSGGPHVTGISDEGIYNLLLNPAGLRGRESTQFSLSFGISSMPDTNDITNTPIELKGPLAFGFMYNGFALGLFMHAVYNGIHKPEKPSQDAIGPTPDVTGDVIFAFGYDINLINGVYSKLDIGFAPTLTVRYDGPTTGYDDPNISSEVYMLVVPAVGLNIGVLYVLGERFSLGASFINAYSNGVEAFYRNYSQHTGHGNPALTISASNIVYTDFAAALNIGASWSVIYIDPLELTLFADARNVYGIVMSGNISDFDIASQFGFGIRAEIINRFIISVGMTESLPVCSLGFRFRNAKIEVAAYPVGIEIGIRFFKDRV